jgi:hypothetical protein
MKTVCRQKKVWWVERTMDMSLGGEEIEKEDPESSSGWQNTTLTARKLVFPTHCVYAIHWTTEACPLIEGSMRRFFYCSYQASSSPRRCNNTIIRRIKICHPRGGGDLAFLYLSLCILFHLIEGVRGSCILFEIYKKRRNLRFYFTVISLSSIFNLSLMFNLSSIFNLHRCITW